jgi:thioredoxin-related protein
MRQLILMITILLSLLLACKRSNPAAEKQALQSQKVLPSITKNRLEVYCFHGTRQCETCKNMKSNTKVVIEKYFAAELKDSSIVFAIVDVDDEKNEKLAEKYQATGTALMVNKIVNGKDSILDWSDFAFEKANENEIYIAELKTMIEDVLKK